MPGKGFDSRLAEIEARYDEVEALLGDPAVTADQNRYRELAKEHSDKAELAVAVRRYRQAGEELEANEELLQDEDPEMRDLAREESDALKAERGDLAERIKVLLIPKDPNDDKNILIEIRGGTGGEEAALFAADLFKMYVRYAEKHRWKVEMLSHHETDTGGFKEVVALIQGKGAYSRLKYESGVHRVQRVPATETQGRIHTSAASVAVMPEAEDVDVAIDPNDLRVDIFRSSGPGGQSVNTTDSAVRLTHLPTGLVVQCQDERSQLKNRAKAMKVLQARLLDKALAEQNAEISQVRRAMVGSGDRSERIRTYNFPQGRLTDHRIGLTLYRLEEILGGEMEELIDQINVAFQAKALEGEA